MKVDQSCVQWCALTLRNAIIILGTGDDWEGGGARHSDGQFNLFAWLMGTLLAFCFTIFIMHKACTTFQDADGTITIAIFYFQIVALLFKDRAADFGPPPLPPLALSCR